MMRCRLSIEPAKSYKLSIDKRTDFSIYCLYSANNTYIFYMFWRLKWQKYMKIFPK